MSKASEYREKNKEIESKKPREISIRLDNGLFAKVDTDGYCFISHSSEFNSISSPAQALSLAHWILDTFGEEEK